MPRALRPAAARRAHGLLSDLGVSAGICVNVVVGGGLGLGLGGGGVCWRTARREHRHVEHSTHD